MTASVIDDAARRLVKEYATDGIYITSTKVAGSDKAKITFKIADRRDRPKSTPKDPWKAQNNVRRREIERVYQTRYGGVLPDDDSGLSDLIPAIRHILATESEQNARRFAASWAPWCDGDRFDELVEEIGDPTPQKAWELGKELQLTYALRKHLKIRTIGPCDITKREFTKLKKEEDAERQRYRRLLKGGKPYGWLASHSKTKTRPWAALGWSRATYYRKLKELGNDAINTMLESVGAIPKQRETSPSGVNLLSLQQTHLSQSGLDHSHDSPAAETGSLPVEPANDNLIILPQAAAAAAA